MIGEFRGKYRFLSNFFKCEIKAFGLIFQSVEHAYQAAKCFDIADRLKFIGITAAEAKALGRTVKVRPDWEDVKINIMYNLLMQKFHDNKEFRALLDETGEELIVEGNTWGDTFWGVCNGKGSNHLGILLMKIRKLNREENWL